VTNKAINAPAKKASMGATPNPWGASGEGNDALGGGGGEIIEIETKVQYDQVLASAGNSLVVIDFTATWCGPCQRIKPRYHDMASEFPQCFFCQVFLEPYID
jgi:thiol-disulfide isomerase/thioredoxin